MYSTMAPDSARVMAPSSVFMGAVSRGWRKGFQFWWGEEGGAGVGFEVVGEEELFAEIDDAFGLGAG